MLTDEVCKLPGEAGSQGGHSDWKKRGRESVARLQSSDSFSGAVSKHVRPRREAINQVIPAPFHPMASIIWLFENEPFYG